MANIITQEFRDKNISWYWGILAESTQIEGQRIFHVYIPDLMPFKDGHLNADEVKDKIKLFNIISQAWEEVTIVTADTIIAEYLNFESSREVPDMYKGQQVLVLSYNGVDKWFWIPLERDDHLKTFEHVKFRCANTADIHKLDVSGYTSANPDIVKRTYSLSNDNTYYLDIDTKYHKHIVLSTSCSDGEKYRYTIEIDALAHLIRISDIEMDPTTRKPVEGAFNQILLESDPPVAGTPDNLLRQNGKITINNSSGTTIVLDGPNLNVNVPGNVNFHAGGTITTQIDSDAHTAIRGRNTVDITGDHLSLVGGTTIKRMKKDALYIYDENSQIIVTGAYDVSTNKSVSISTAVMSITTSATYTVNTEVLTAKAKKAALYQSTAVTIQGSAISLASGNISATSKIKD